MGWKAVVNLALGWMRQCHGGRAQPLHARAFFLSSGSHGREFTRRVPISNAIPLGTQEIFERPLLRTESGPVASRIEPLCFRYPGVSKDTH